MLAGKPLSASDICIGAKNRPFLSAHRRGRTIQIDRDRIYKFLSERLWLVSSRCSWNLPYSNAIKSIVKCSRRNIECNLLHFIPWDSFFKLITMVNSLGGAFPAFFSTRPLDKSILSAQILHDAGLSRRRDWIFHGNLLYLLFLFAQVSVKYISKQFQQFPSRTKYKFY